jgi:hypothetical protein
MEAAQNKYTPAIYTHCFDSSGTRLFAAGGPLQCGLKVRSHTLCSSSVHSSPPFFPSFSWVSGIQNHFRRIRLVLKFRIWSVLFKHNFVIIREIIHKVLQVPVLNYIRSVLFKHNFVIRREKIHEVLQVPVLNYRLIICPSGYR